MEGLKSFVTAWVRCAFDNVILFYPNPYHIRSKSVSSILLDASSVWSLTETKFESEITEQVSHHGLGTSQPQGVEPALQISFILCIDSYGYIFKRLENENHSIVICYMAKIQILTIQKDFSSSVIQAV